MSGTLLRQSVVGSSGKRTLSCYARTSGAGRLAGRCQLHWRVPAQLGLSYTDVKPVHRFLQRSSTRCRHALQCKAAALTDAYSLPVPRPKNGALTVLGGVAGLLGCAAIAAYTLHDGFKTALMSSVLGRSGFLAAMSLIFFSELGDKTFFISALLAVRVGKWMSFVGSVATLSVMTAISVGIGMLCANVPASMHTQLPIGEYVGAAMLVFFGIRHFMDAARMRDEEKVKQAQMDDAAVAVSNADAAVAAQQPRGWVKFMEVASLIFVGEWGDRSMLATIALAVSATPTGVMCGAMAAHVASTAIAVVGGALVAQHISERSINVVAGTLFMLFALFSVVKFF